MSSMPPPPWFRQAIATEPQNGRFAVDGCDIHHLAWGTPGGEPVVLVHGNGAHARWWSFVAPFLAARGRHVGALDLGGMGESSDPGPQSPEMFARQIAAFAERTGGGRPVALVGHSFGGLVAVGAVLHRPELFRRLVVIDTPFHMGDRPPRSRGRKLAGAVHRDLADILRRFRLLPEQDCPDYVMDYIARHSVAEVRGGWSWKFRQNPWDSPHFESDIWTRHGTALATLRQPVALLRAEQSSLCPPEAEAAWRAMAGPRVAISMIPAACHHAPLDQPVAVAAVIDALLSAPE
ncbi:MAG: alpha/beta hydrolase [Alphaproteobacteria bacterium]|nr:alpha/beta hydrolase [Alphaproteobacteria bacterium]